MSEQRPLRVADFVLDGRPTHLLPSGEALVRMASELRDDRVAVDLHTTKDGWGIVHPGHLVSMDDGNEVDVDSLSLADTRRVRLSGGGLCTLEQVLLAAHRCHIGVVFRVRSTLAAKPLGAGIGVTGGAGHAAFRRRFLAVVPDQRIGKRLRSDAREVPSALEIRRGERGLHAFLRRSLPNLARAGAAADDLLVPHDAFPWPKIENGLLPTLRRRGAGLWLSDVPPDSAGNWDEHPIAGVFVRREIR
jgi:hypothetical protein